MLIPYNFSKLWLEFFLLKKAFNNINESSVTTNGTLSRSLWSPLTACCRSRTWSSFWRRKGSSSRPTATRRRSRRRRTERRPQTSPTTRPRRAGNRKNKRFVRLKSEFCNKFETMVICEFKGGLVVRGLKVKFKFERRTEKRIFKWIWNPNKAEFK